MRDGTDGGGGGAGANSYPGTDGGGGAVDASGSRGSDGGGGAAGGNSYQGTDGGGGAVRANGQPGPLHDSARCRFELAPPRRFRYPAILLLLAEQPRHGYRLVDALLALGFGPVDRPSVYRALADLEQDGLVESWPATPTAGCKRHVYGLTTVGGETLRRWMTVVDEERESLERVLARYGKVAGR